MLLKYHRLAVPVKLRRSYSNGYIIVESTASKFVLIARDSSKNAYVSKKIILGVEV